MRHKLIDNLPHERIPVEQEEQITDSHCGPAVLQTLLANLGIRVTQEDIADAGGALETIEVHGMRIDQLAHAVHKIAPDIVFWIKFHSRINDLVEVVQKRRYPVGVEWQGLFETADEILEDNDDEDEEEDYGHYSIISYIDQKNRQLIIVDPYKDFVKQDRIFPIEVFRRRWWDTNEVIDPVTGRHTYPVDRRLMFILTPPDETFPLEIGMKRI